MEGRKDKSEPGRHAELGQTKALLRAFHEPLAKPPVWIMRQAGRYLPEYRAVRASAGSFLDLCLSPQLATEVTLQPIRRFGFDGAILFSDILMVPYGLGRGLSFVEGEGPKLDPLRTRGELDALDRAGFHARLEPVYEAVSRIKQALPQETTLLGFAGAPWTVASYMIEGEGSRDYATIKLLGYRDPELLADLLDVLAQVTADYLTRQVHAGAEALVLFESWASAVPAHRHEEWLVRPVRTLVDRLRANGVGEPIIAFPRALGAALPSLAGMFGADGIAVDQGVPLEVARQLQSTHLVQGNLDPQLLVAGGEGMRRQVARIREQLGEGRFIFNLGHGIVPETPPEHVAELVSLIRMD